MQSTSRVQHQKENTINNERRRRRRKRFSFSKKARDNGQGVLAIIGTPAQVWNNNKKSAFFFLPFPDPHVTP